MRKPLPFRWRDGNILGRVWRTVNETTVDSERGQVRLHLVRGCQLNGLDRMRRLHSYLGRAIAWAESRGLR